MPFAWVAADAVCGVGDIEQVLRRAGKGYVLGVKGDHRFGSWGDKPVVAGTAAQIANDLDFAAWQRLSAGQGTKGERVHDWAYFELADLEADEYVYGVIGTWTRRLLMRRHVAGDDLAFFTTWCPAGTTIETRVGVEGHRWAIGDSFETAKNELGLDHHETRSWHGWRRHVSLAMLAFARLAAIRTRDNAAPPKRAWTSHRPDPLVRPGNSPYRHQAGTATHRASSRYRLVMLATCPSSRRTALAFPIKNATVILGRVCIYRSQIMAHAR